MKPFNKTSTSIDATGCAHGEKVSPVNASVFNDGNYDFNVLVKQVFKWLESVL